MPAPVKLALELVVLADRDPCTERVERVHVRVDAPPADDVASGRGHDGLAAPSEQRPGKEDRGSDFTAEILVELVRRDLSSVDAHVVRPDPVRVRPDVAQEGEHRIHVPDTRDVLEVDGLVREQAAGQDRQRRVLVAGRADVT